MRKLRIPGRPSRAVLIRIGAPRRLRDGWDWGCPVEIDGLDEPQRTYIFGADGIQALQLALEYITARVTNAGTPVVWFENGDDGGFTRSIPLVLPQRDRRMLTIAIDQAGRRWAKRMERRARTRK